MVAVRSHDSSVHPVACVGTQRTLTSISRELGGGVDIVLWSESLESFILNALAPFARTAVTLDAAKHQALVEVKPETLTHFSGEHALRVRLTSKLVGWDIQLVANKHK
jgi:N utilization substance protein A